MLHEFRELFLFDMQERYRILEKQLEKLREQATAGGSEAARRRLLDLVMWCIHRGRTQLREFAQTSEECWEKAALRVREDLVAASESFAEAAAGLRPFAADSEACGLPPGNELSHTRQQDVCGDAGGAVVKLGDWRLSDSAGGRTESESTPVTAGAHHG
jgi:hypothetical protein